MNKVIIVTLFIYSYIKNIGRMGSKVLILYLLQL